MYLAKTRIRLSIRAVLLESSLFALWIFKDTKLVYADGNGSDQTARMYRPMFIFAGQTCHFAGFVVTWLYS